MSEARVLSFPFRWGPGELSPEEALVAARAYLAKPLAERSEEWKKRFLCDRETLFSLCKLLREQADVSPGSVADEASSLYRWMDATRKLENERDYLLGDEREYLLGEAALLAGGAYRHLGRREEAERWLELADAGFRHTTNPAPLLANVAYARLALRYDMRRYQDVLELLPSLLRSFETAGMARHVAKARFLEAMTLKECGRTGEAFEKFETLRETVREDAALLGQVLIQIGEQQASEGRYEPAVRNYEEALPLVRRANRPIALANLKAAMGETLRNQGRLPAALEAYRGAQLDYCALGMRTVVAYLHVVIAETLLAVERDREAEWEILAALPTIQEEKMVPEGFAAITLLQESVRRRKADPEALRQLREHLQANR